MSQIIMGNGGFTVAGVNLKVFQRGGKKQHKHMYSFFLVHCCSINQAQTLTTRKAHDKKSEI